MRGVMQVNEREQEIPVPCRGIGFTIVTVFLTVVSGISLQEAFYVCRWGLAS